jgi:hypothetical protein
LKRILVVTLLTACHFGEAPNVPTPAGGIPANLVLRTYDVPGDGAAQVRAVLKDVFWIGSDGKDSNKYLGRAEVAPNGRLAVMASEGVQEGVKAFIDSLAQKPPKPAPTLETTYWLVFGTPGQSAAPSPALGEVASALQQIEKADGPTEFTLGEKLTMTQVSGEMAKVQGRDAQVRQSASSNGTVISAELSLERMGQKFETRVNLTPGQILVLGSSGAVTREKSLPLQTVYVLMRAGIHDGKSP